MISLWPCLCRTSYGGGTSLPSFDSFTLLSFFFFLIYLFFYKPSCVTVLLNLIFSGVAHHLCSSLTGNTMCMVCSLICKTSSMALLFTSAAIEHWVRWPNLNFQCHSNNWNTPTIWVFAQKHLKLLVYCRYICLFFFLTGIYCCHLSLSASLIMCHVWKCLQCSKKNWALCRKRHSGLCILCFFSLKHRLPLDSSVMWCMNDLFEMVMNIINAPLSFPGLKKIWGLSTLFIPRFALR